MDKLSKLVDGKILKFNDDSNIKVFVCGGASKVSEEYYIEAYNIGKLLAKLGVSYLQGGVSDRKTMMGESYHGYIETSGNSAYFITRKFGTEYILKDLDNLQGVFEVDDIGQLIKAQFLWSDIVIIMPGGTGTLIELLGYIEQKYDYPDKKPIVIVFNKQIEGKGYFDNFFEQIRQSQRCGFTPIDIIENNFTIVKTFNDLKECLLNRVEEYNRKWIF